MHVELTVVNEDAVPQGIRLVRKIRLTWYPLALDFCHL
jgi:hypothetical protein